MSSKAVWIDLDNSPHVPLFVPVIAAYRAVGIEVVVTARDHSQTIELLENAELGGTFTKLGRHYGKSKINKIRGLFERAAQLVTFVKARRRDGSDIRVAISHGSRTQVLAARWLGIPMISMYDYEFTETVIFNRFSEKVMIPDTIPDATLDAIGLAPAKRVKYAGLKEELYLNQLTPDADFWTRFKATRNLQIGDETIVVVLRPPATTANYHNEDSEVLLRELLKHFLGHHEVFTIILPRTGEQRDEIAHLIDSLSLDAARCHIVERAVNGLDLTLAADLLVSGGGTMNREAVLLGTPVYSIFAGKQGALDAAMERDGRLTFIRRPEDVAKIKLEKKDAANRVLLDDRVESAVKAQIDAYL